MPECPLCKMEINEILFREIIGYEGVISDDEKHVFRTFGADVYFFCPKCKNQITGKPVLDVLSGGKDKSH